MTFRPLAPWIPLDDLLAKPLYARVKYVRENLATSRDRSQNPYLSHDDFAAAVGSTQRGSAIRWEKPRVEKGSAPKRYAKAIAKFTPYPPEAFGAPGEAELVQETLGRRLRLLEARYGWLRSQMIVLAARASVELELELEPQDDQAAEQVAGLPG